MKQQIRFWIRVARRGLSQAALVPGLVLLVCLQPTRGQAHEGDASGTASETGTLNASSGANSAPSGSGPAVPTDVMEEIADLRDKANKSEPLDEALGGKTLQGTPVFPRTPAYFPAEQRDLFWRMDWVANPGTGVLEPIDFDQDQDGLIDGTERNAIRGRNTWLMWGGGNEAFWGWLQERGYGIVDFLVLVDSRKRAERFKVAGVINQPGFVSDSKPNSLGLFLDKAGPDGYLRPRGWDDIGRETMDAQGRKLTVPVERPSLPHGGLSEPFEPGDRALYDTILKEMPRDGLDYSVYGYPSGVLGLRLMLNPDFFGKTKAAEKAREYWRERVMPDPDRYYLDSRTVRKNPKVHADPMLVRPFRVSMSCGFCHIGPHPLNPPADPAEPKWNELSSIIGSQYWMPQTAFGNLTTKGSFLHHFLNSQAPGTIDTSLVSSDQLNNTNVINAVFDVPARLERALTKPPEIQAGSNLLFLNKSPTDPPVALHCPMVLFPGEDSVGVLPALARVPLNIGVFSELWAKSDNPLIGFTPQRPFSVATCRTNSVYWMVNERYRVPYMAAFFTHGSKQGAQPAKVVKATNAMRLRDAGPVWQESAKGDGRKATDSPVAGKDYGKAGETAMPLQKLESNHAVTKGAALLAGGGGAYPEVYKAGREVFLNSCAICHSSKQPAKFGLAFARTMELGWEDAPAPVLPKDAAEPVGELIYTLPMSYADWDSFATSPSMKDYRRRIHEVAKEGEWTDDEFLRDNFLSTELRIPVTLVGTCAGRALATNAMAGNVWNDYSSDTFKKLPSVGKIRYFDPGSPTGVDVYGTNAEFDDGRVSGGPGYMRPPTLISVWATAPYFHNNALGLYTGDPSIEGRMRGFEDGIEKLLNRERRGKETWFKPVPGSAGYDDTLEVNADGLASFRHPGDLRGERAGPAQRDPGYIYRLPQDTRLQFAARFIPFLIKGIAGPVVFSILSCWIWVLLVGLFGWAYWRGRARHAGILVIVLSAVVGLAIALTGQSGNGGTVAGAMTMAAMDIEWQGLWLWLIPLAGLAFGGWLTLTRRELMRPIRYALLALTLLTLVTGLYAHKFLNGRLKNRTPLIALMPNSWTDGDEYKGIDVGPVPRGTPVNLLMNLDPEKKDKLPAAVAGMVKAMVRIRKEKLSGERAWEIFERDASPALLAASKCPDFVLDRGHWFGEGLTTRQKSDLTAFLKSL